MNLIENLNSILWVLFGVLCVVEAALRWGFPGYRKNPANAGLVETIDSFWIAMAVALSLKAVWVQPFTIPSGSMEDTLQVGDYILVKKYEYGYSFLNKTPRFFEYHKPQRKDVVVFVFPLDPSKDFIKRCVGIPGDVIEYKNKVLFINGEKQDEPYAKHVDFEIHPRNFAADQIDNGSRDNFGPVTVLPGHYFMMGDNRDNSYDCRYWGQLEENLIKGQAWFIYWHSVGYADFFALVALAVAAFSLLFLLWELLPRRSASPAEAMDAKAKMDSLKSHLFTIVVCCVLAGVLVGATGMQTFKDNCRMLKERMFTVIK
ncbi:MAG TPA: signal peptidase I [bacterium]|nr:signal peptidase I [bacterium]